MFRGLLNIFPFGCAFCLSRLAERNINISNDSVKKLFWYIRIPEWKNSGGKVCYVRNKITANGFQHKTRLLYRTQQCTDWRTEKMIWIVFISILRAGNCLTAGIFAVVREKWNWRLKNIRDFIEKLTEYRLTCGQNVSMGWLFAVKSKQFITI